MINNARIHLEGELPVLADLNAMPGPLDVSLLCTNLRTTDGKQPTFIHHSASWFVIPLAVVRFVEMPASAVESAVEEAESESAPIQLPGSRGSSVSDELAADDFEPDEAFLQRIRDI